MVRISAQRLLQQAQERVLTADEMGKVINHLYGPENWTAIQFAVAQVHVQPALFTTLLKGCGIDVRKIRTNTHLFAAAAKRRLTEQEMDELMRFVYGPESPLYTNWAANLGPVAKECDFMGRMLAHGVDIPPEVFSLVINQ